MKVLLINSRSLYVKQKAAIPLGLLSIATYLTQHGHIVQIYDRPVERRNLKSYLNCFSPDIVGISAYVFNSFPDAIKVSKAIKTRKIPVIWGGSSTSLIPEIVLKSGVVDYVVVGEGEITMLALMEAIIHKTSLHNIDGLAFINKGNIIINKARDAADLAQLPIIDFRFVDPRKYWITNLDYNKMLFIYASKGCPYQCTYCYNPCFSKGLWRSRPPEYFLSEIKYLIEKHDMNGVYFADDTFSTNKEYTFKVCNNIIDSGLKFVWSANMRADTCKKDELQIMYDAGCRWIFFGIESGSEERQKSIKKRIDLGKAKEIIDYCNEIGIITTTSYIIGYPDENEDELRETINCAKKMNSNYKIASFYGPIPKSELYAYLVESKKLSIPQSYNDWEKLTWMDTLGNNFSKVPNRDLKVISSYFFLKIFARKTEINNSQSHAWVNKLFGQTVDILKRGTIRSLYLVFLSAKQFLEILFYATMFPKIRRKYNLMMK